MWWNSQGYTKHIAMTGFFMNFFKVVFVLFVFILIACESNRQNEAHTAATCAHDYACSFVQSMGHQIGYPLKDRAVYDHEIRLWMKYEVIDLTELHILKDVDSISYLSVYYLNDQIEDRNPFQIDSLKASSRLHDVSAKDLTRQLYALDFRDQVSQPDSIKMRIADGVSFVVEVRDSTYYKMVDYNSPHLFKNENHRNFLQLLDMLEKNLDWKYRRY